MINPHYSSKTTSPPVIPFFKSVTVKNLNAVLGSQPDGPITPIITLEGYDSAHQTSVTPDNVLIQSVAPANVLSDANTLVTFGSQGANFAVPPSVAAAGNPSGISCDWGWPVPRPQQVERVNVALVFLAPRPASPIKARHRHLALAGEKGPKCHALGRAVLKVRSYRPSMAVRGPGRRAPPRQPGANRHSAQ
jgi:hypothetical protein